MKHLSDILNEKNNMKTFEATIGIEVTMDVKNTDITNAGKEVEQEMDQIQSELIDLGYDVRHIQINEIEEKVNSISESVELNELEDELVLNQRPNEKLEDDIIDIFNIVEKRINNLDETFKERGLELLKNIILNYNLND